MKKKILTLIMMTTMIGMVGMFAGCGDTSSSSGSETTSSGSEETNTDSDDGTTMGRVTAVGDSSITIMEMNMSGGGRGGNASGDAGGKMSSGDAPEAPADGEAPTGGEAPADGEAPTGGEAPADGEAPTGGEAPADGEAPTDGEAPEMPADASGDGKAMGNGGETVEVKVDDNTTYTKMDSDNTTETITLADIQEGDMISITYGDDNETAVSIEVQNMDNMRGGKKNAAETTESDAL